METLTINKHSKYHPCTPQRLHPSTRKELSGSSIEVKYASISVARPIIHYDPIYFNNPEPNQ